MTQSSTLQMLHTHSYTKYFNQRNFKKDKNELRFQYRLHYIIDKNPCVESLP